jgi:Flp pilus assembly protein CpaB
MAVVLAMLLAFAATLAVFLYVRGVRQEAKTGGGTVDVIVSKQDIPVGQALNALIEEGVFTTKGFPQDSLVQGVVTDLNQLRGQTAAFPVLAGEQISTLRFQGLTQFSGLGLQKGFQAVTISLEGPQGGAGFISRGDHVTVFVSMDIKLLPGAPGLRQVLNGRAGTNQQQNAGTWTLTAVPDVRVLQALGAGPVQLTLELTPKDAVKVIHAKEYGRLWLSLIAPGDKGQVLPPVNVGDLIGGLQPV